MTQDKNCRSKETNFLQSVMSDDSSSIISDAQLRISHNTADSMSGAAGHVLRGNALEQKPSVILHIESKKGRKVDALDHRGDEGRDKLR